MKFRLDKKYLRREQSVFRIFETKRVKEKEKRQRDEETWDKETKDKETKRDRKWNDMTAASSSG